MLSLWWAALHIYLPLVAAAPGLPRWMWPFAALAALVHCIARYPAVPGRLSYSAPDSWGLPDESRDGLRLGPGSRWTGLWVDLELTGPGGRRIVLLRDQLDAESWRRLSAGIADSLAARS